jgi:hypothetical protein
VQSDAPPVERDPFGPDGAHLDAAPIRLADQRCFLAWVVWRLPRKPRAGRLSWPAHPRIRLKHAHGRVRGPAVSDQRLDGSRCGPQAPGALIPCRITLRRKGSRPGFDGSISEERPGDDLGLCLRRVRLDSRESSVHREGALIRTAPFIATRSRPREYLVAQRYPGE